MQLQEMHVQPPSSRYSLNSDGVFFVKKRFSPDLSNGVYTAIGDEEDSFTVNSRRKLLPIVFTVVLILLSMGAFLLSFQRTILTTALSKTTPFKPVVHPDLPTSYWGTTPKPYPTGAFWTNLVVKDGDGAIGLYPYGIRTVDTGIQVSYGAFRRHVTNQAIADIFTSDLEVSAMENYVSRGVESHDNISVTMTYKTINNGKFSTHLVKCSPFVTVVYTSSTPVLRSPLMHIIAVDARVMQNSTGVQYIVTLGNFQKWLVYCSVPVSLVWTEDTLTSAVPISGVVRVAVLPIQTAEAAFATLLQYVGKYPISATTSVSFLDLPVSTATITYAFKTVGSGPLLMLALPHQIPLFQSPAINNAEHLHLLSVYEPIYSIKGKLRPIVGDSWRLTYSLVTAGWNYVVTETLGIDQLNTIAFNLLMDVNNVLPTAVDPYTFGKQLGRMCTIALMADNLGIAAVRTTALLNIETALTPWLTGTNTDALLFDRTYGGVVSSAGLADQYADFGSGWYSDHHFHYGYFINAGAVLAKLDRPYFDANKNAFDALVRDVANYDATDVDFPIARHKDMFDGHSWASGLYQQSNGKGQESSSEAVNAYYGAYLYGVATSNPDLSHFAQLLLTMEIQAAQTYWHMDSDDIYDNVFAAASRMVGNIGALDVTATTWFGDDLKYVHGINIMPLTPVTSSLFDAQYVQAQYPILAQSLPTSKAVHTAPQCASNAGCSALNLTGMCCPNEQGQMLGCCDKSANNALSDEFVSYIYIDLAVVDRETAWTKILAQSSFGNGNSKSNSLFWAATRSPPVARFNASYVARSSLAGAVRAECNANTACDVLGIIGECCPTKTGILLGCCPTILLEQA